MLTEKSDIINDILARRLQIEKDVYSSCETLLVAHVADIFKECNEP